ncbi:hypothetical protein POSPLADRAFT_1066338 [Postia placenta MAD-698-R-SB12]|uniref:PB1 domain-containing protein n=1 Tax=Postia placenta MAD-698-R-SB12 TaxID=670580 RepID=A0A1X6MZX5_9APHY|nr:hypothetical protein POSPLADRAFT_1066338 [Postia placenta MAD-698-R-SB12]OSX61905.1 hypothetical protein POSPLADRAFT_1066338 [Postia placenta MAD-698-R-SB12]
MSLKAELETWASALKAYDEENFDKSLQLFSEIGDSSKILTNMGLIYATLGEHDAAVEQFTAATQLDQYLAVAYFQCGVSNFLLGRYETSLRDFDDALLYLRGNGDINYEQLGLKFKLYSAEVLFNKGLAHIYMGQVDQGLAELQEARKEKVTPEHSVIDDAIADRGDGYTVFSIPVGVLYRPAEKKLKNAKTKDYMGKAKLIATEDASEAFTEFTGVARMRQGVSPTGATDFGPGGLQRAATVSNPTPPPKSDDYVRSAALQRANTTINVSVDRFRSNPASPASPATSPGSGPPSAPALSRNASFAGRMQPTRGLSIRKPGTDAPPPSTRGMRTTEFYDSYLDSYADAPSALPPVPEARPAPAAVRRAPSRARAAPQSTYSNGSVRRRPTRRGTVRSRYEEEEEEGYGSGEYEYEREEDGFVKIRVKLHYADDVRGMALSPGMPWEEFLERVTGKFGRELDGLGMKFKDEDGGMVSLRDEMDYELAIETAREQAKGKPEGRLEIWCTDE